MSMTRAPAVIRTVFSEVCCNSTSGRVASEGLWPNVITVEDSPAEGTIWEWSLTMIVGTKSARRRSAASCRTITVSLDAEISLTNASARSGEFPTAYLGVLAGKRRPRPIQPIMEASSSAIVASRKSTDCASS